MIPVNCKLCLFYFHRLYNKEAVLEFLIDRSKFECASSFEHLKGLKVLQILCDKCTHWYIIILLSYWYIVHLTGILSMRMNTEK